MEHKPFAGHGWKTQNFFFTNASSLYLREHSCQVHFNVITEGNL